MKKLLLLLTTTTLLLTQVPLAQAQSTPGEVVKVDKAASRITIKHSGIKNLDVPAMTLAFRAREPKWLDGLNAGDRVRFDAEKADGGYTVTALVKAPG